MTIKKPIAERIKRARLMSVVIAICANVTLGATTTRVEANVGNTPEKLEALSEAYLANPGDHKLRVALGLALVEHHQYQRAERLLSAAYRKEQSDEIAIGLAQTRYALGQYQEALNLLRARGATENSERTKRRLRLEALIRLRRFDEVTAVAGNEESANDPALAFAMARARYGLGDVTPAIDLTDEVLRTGYALPEAWLFRARIALQQNEIEFARKALRRAAEAGLPQSSVAPFIIEADIRDGLFDKAQQAIKAQQNQIKPGEKKDARLVYAAGFLAAAQGDFDHAARLFDAVAPWLAGEPRGLLLMAEAKIQSGALAQGEALLTRHLNAASNDWIALDMAAALSLRKKSYNDALGFAERFGNSGSTNLSDRASFRRYQIFSAQKKFDLAYIQLKKQARAQPSGHAFQSPRTLLFGGPYNNVMPHKNDLADYVAGIEKMRAYYAVENKVEAEGKSPGSEYESNPVILAINSNKLIAARRYDQAIALLDRATAIAPDFSEAVRLRKRIDIRRGNFKAVELHLWERNSDNQLSDWERLELANAYLNSGDLAGAQEMLDMLDNSDVTNPVVAALRGRTLWELNDTKAYKKLARALASRGDDPHRQVFAAKMLEAVNENNAAIKVAKRALSSAPDDLEALHYFKSLMVRNDRQQEAKTFLRILVRRRDYALNARYALATLAAAMDDPETVDSQLSVLKKANTPLAEVVEAHRLIASGDKEAARKAGQDLAKVNFAQPSLAIEAAKVAANAGADDGAEAILLEAYEDAPSNYALAIEIATFYLDRRKPAAITYADKAYRLSDAAPESAVLYALALWQEGQTEAALAVSREAVWAGLPVEGYSLALAAALKSNGQVDLAGAIMRQIRASWLSAAERESADKLLGSLTRIQVQPDEFKRLRG